VALPARRLGRSARLAHAWLRARGGSRELRLRSAVGSLRRDRGRWLVAATTARRSRRRAVVVCDGSGTASARSGAWPVRRQRGQTTAVGIEHARGAAARSDRRQRPRRSAARRSRLDRHERRRGATTTPTSARRAAAQPRARSRACSACGRARSRRLAGGSRFAGQRRPPADRRGGPGVDRRRAIAGLRSSLAAGGRPRPPRRARPGLFVCAALGSRGVARRRSARIVAAQIAGAPLPARPTSSSASIRRASRAGNLRAHARCARGTSWISPRRPIAGSLGG
jgi:hypothetical protein